MSEINFYSPLPFRESKELESNQDKKLPEIGPPEIPIEEIIFDKEKDFLGEGAYGRVYKGKCRGKEVAIKVPLKQKLSEEELKAFRHEVQIMRRIFHPNVVLFLGACTSDNSFMIVTELMETDLDKIIHSNKHQQLTPVDKIKLAKDAALGMNWLGLLSIVHRDLKPSNLLIDKHNVLKVTDFGFSAFKSRDQELKDKIGPKGTALYMSPEVMNKQPFNEKSDVYSFGLILWELWTGKDLFPEFDDWDPFFEAVCIKNIRPPIPNDCLPSLAYLIQKCWSPKSVDRPSFKEIVFRLDEIIVDCYLPNAEGRQHVEEARKFWKENFLVTTQSIRESIPWREFSKILSNETNLPISDFQNLQQILASKLEGSRSNDDFVVTIERFGKIVQWFGPFFIPSEATKILSEISPLISATWFHGDISKGNLNIISCNKKKNKILQKNDCFVEKEELF
jgi:serine/threonine protein kinase